MTHFVLVPVEVVTQRGSHTRVWLAGIDGTGYAGDLLTSDLEHYLGSNTYTEADFVEACQSVLGKDVADVMLKGTVGGKVTTMNMAIHQAFVHGCTDAKAVAVLRSTAKGLNELGYLAFRQPEA